LRALEDFTDVYGIKRTAGELWVLSGANASSYIVGVKEELHSTTSLYTLTST